MGDRAGRDPGSSGIPVESSRVSRSSEAYLNDPRALLQQIPLFRALRGTELDALAKIAVPRRIQAHEVLFHKGELGSQLFAVASGRLKAVSHSSDGREMVFAILDRGEVFGEIALFDGEPRSATVIALERSTLLILQRRDLMPLVQQNRDLMMSAFAFLGRRLRSVSTLAEDAMFLTIPARFAKRLLALSRLYGVRTGEGIRIDLKLTQQELGQLVGATRESINKHLRQWSDEGVLRVHAGQITILGEDSLQTLAALVRI